MKRRRLLSFATVSGLGLAFGSYRYLSFQYPLTYKNCPAIASNSSPQLRFAVLGDVGSSREQYRFARTLRCYSETNPLSLVALYGFQGLIVG